MGTRQLRILSYTGKRAYQYYIDGLKVNAKRQRLFFKDEKSAKAKRVIGDNVVRLSKTI
jgi:hypothetical protein